MAKQKIILYHSSGTTLPVVSAMSYGEIAVMHNTTSPEIVFRGNGDKTIEIFGNQSASGDSYVNATLAKGALTISANMVSESDFKSSAATVSGMLVDAQVVKSVIEENEKTTAAALNNHETRIVALEGISGGTRIAALESAVASATTRIETLESSATSANSRIATLEASATSANTRIATLESDVIKVVKVNSSALTKTNNEVNLAIATGDNDGTIKFNGENIKVKSIDTAAYKTVEFFQGTTASTSADTTIVGAKKYADQKDAELKATVDAYTVNGKAISGNPVLNGIDVKLSGYTKAESGSSVAADDTLNVAIGKLEKQIENAVAGGLQEVESGNGITVSAVANNKQTISAKIASGDNVLSVDANGIKSTLSIHYDDTNKKIQLSGVTGAFSEIDASVFIKDAMLYGQHVFFATGTSQTITIKEQSHTFSGLTVGHQYLAMCFTNGEWSGTTYSWEIIDLQNIVDVYSAGDGLQLTDVESGKTHQFSIKLDSANENFLTVSSNGLKLSGVQNAIDTAKAAVIGNSGDTWSGNTTVWAVKNYVDSEKYITSVSATTSVELTVNNHVLTAEVTTIDGGEF